MSHTFIIQRNSTFNGQVSHYSNYCVFHGYKDAFDKLHCDLGDTENGDSFTISREQAIDWLEKAITCFDNLKPGDSFHSTYEMCKIYEFLNLITLHNDDVTYTIAFQ